MFIIVMFSGPSVNKYAIVGSNLAFYSVLFITLLK